MDTSRLHGIDIRIADLGGTTLGLASGNTIWLDDNAAGWGWFVDPTPWDDSEFTTPGNQGEQNRMDLLSAVMHEMGHVLGLEHSDHDDDVMYETLAAGERHASPDQHDLALFSLGIEFEHTWAAAQAADGNCVGLTAWRL